MKETGITMTGDHPAKILADLKTNTRRVLVPQPFMTHGIFRFEPKETISINMTDHSDLAVFHCPYGQVGDRLWVRETWASVRCWHCDDGYEEEDCTCFEPPVYKADKPNYPLRDDDKWKPSIHMPRWASRLTLEITGVRVERLNEITEEDVRAEGIRCYEDVLHLPPTVSIASYITAEFVSLWDSLNAKRGYGWETNPWVWVIEFKKYG